MQKEALRKKYSLAEGFECKHLSDTYDIYRKNDMAVHFVFYYDSLDHMQNNWEADHENSLVKYYVEKVGQSIDINYNYYAIFVVGNLVTNGSDSEKFSCLTHLIENNMYYSRKYVFNGISSVVIPGVFPETGNNTEIPAFNPADHWEEQLEGELYRIFISDQNEKDLEKSIEEYLSKLEIIGAVNSHVITTESERS